MGTLRWKKRTNLAVPTLALDPSWRTWQASPLFVITANWLEDDDLQFEYRLVGAPSWIVSNHTILINEINGAVIDLGISALANGDYEARCKLKHLADATYSSYSSAVPFTVDTTVLPVVTYRGNGYSSGSSSVTDYSINVGPGGSLLVVTSSWQNALGITSFVFDPGGLNITMTQDVYYASGHSAAVYSCVLPSGLSGSYIIRQTLVSGGFLGRGIAAWTVTNLLSTTKKQTATPSNSSGNFNIAVDSGDVMFSTLYHDTSGSARTYSSSTEPPIAFRSSNAKNQYAEWAIIDDNGSFSVIPGGAGNVTAAASYR